MKDLLMNSALFGVTLTISTFLLGGVIYRKTHIFLFSPLLVSVTCCIVTLLLVKIPYENYCRGGDWIGFFLTPSTVCLAVPLYEQFEKLKKNWYAILGGITCGVISNLAFIFGMCILFRIGHTEYVSLLPKSITTAIALALTDDYCHDGNHFGKHGKSFCTSALQDFPHYGSCSPRSCNGNFKPCPWNCKSHRNGRH